MPRGSEEPARAHQVHEVQPLTADGVGECGHDRQRIHRSVREKAEVPVGMRRGITPGARSEQHE